jgi:hypothetical protein
MISQSHYWRGRTAIHLPHRLYRPHRCYLLRRLRLLRRFAHPGFNLPQIGLSGMSRRFPWNCSQACSFLEIAFDQHCIARHKKGLRPCTCYHQAPLFPSLRRLSSSSAVALLSPSSSSVLSVSSVVLLRSLPQKKSPTLSRRADSLALPKIRSSVSRRRRRSFCP